jgi:hypothetical protein
VAAARRPPRKTQGTHARTHLPSTPSVSVMHALKQALRAVSRAPYAAASSSITSTAAALCASACVFVRVVHSSSRVAVRVPRFAQPARADMWAYCLPCGPHTPAPRAALPPCLFRCVRPA